MNDSFGEIIRRLKGVSEDRATVCSAMKSSTSSMNFQSISGRVTDHAIEHDYL
jgi:hypothetical protein